jgi:hypothetical protein
MKFLILFSSLFFTHVRCDSYFTVPDAKTNNNLGVLGDKIDYTHIPSPTSRLNIEAVCEDYAPYSTFSSNGVNIHITKIDYGLPPRPPHVVTATPYAQESRQGPPGTNITKSFQVRGCFQYGIIYDVSTDPITPGPIPVTIFTTVPSVPCQVNIEVVTTCGFKIQNVGLKLLNKATNQTIRKQTEYEYKYFLFGNRGENVYAGSIPAGEYIIETSVNGFKHYTAYLTVEHECTYSPPPSPP